ncbi:universal stress protein [Nocardia sp. NBC_01009]|uniref:universal stress protein n=1 Tax=Nocardia sp. NBC_01009 TaxID=2975996 RepID=UPI00386920C6|nr:universal stress protein [Nocardia sp. NBC_01009]
MSAHKNEGIVVTVDRPPIGHDAALWSAALAERLHCSLHIVYIAPEAHPMVADIVRPHHVPILMSAHARATAVLDAAIAAVRRCSPDLELIGELIEGPATQVLATIGKGARMLVLGHPDAGTTDVLAATSRASTITEHTTCPVTVWRGESGQLPDRRPVVLGVDEDADSAEATRMAFEYAHLFAAPLVAVHSRPARPPPDLTTVPDLHPEQDTLDETLSAARQAFPDVAVTATVVSEPPPQALIERAADAQLVVIGTHGRRRMPAGAGASVSPYLFRHSPCPTMVCPPRRRRPRPDDDIARPPRISARPPRRTTP